MRKIADQKNQYRQVRNKSFINESLQTKSLKMLLEASPEQIAARKKILIAARGLQKTLDDNGFKKTALAMKKGITTISSNIADDNDEKVTALFGIIPMAISAFAGFIAALEAIGPSSNMNEASDPESEEARKERINAFVSEPLNLRPDQDDRDAKGKGGGADSEEAQQQRIAAHLEEPIDIRPAQDDRDTKGKGKGADSKEAQKKRIRHHLYKRWAKGKLKQRADARKKAGGTGGNDSKATHRQAGDTGGNDSDDRTSVLTVLSQDDADGKAIIQKVISNSFKPNPSYMNYLKKNSPIVKAAMSVVRAAKEKSDTGVAKENYSSSNSPINEGFFDFLKGFFTTSSPKASATVQGFLPLFGGQAVHKLLVQDLIDSSDVKFASLNKMLDDINKISNTLFPSAPAPAAEPPSATPSADGGGGRTMGSNGGGTTADGGRGGDGVAATAGGGRGGGGGDGGGRGGGGGSSAADSGASTKKSIKSMLDLNDTTARAVLARMSDADISITGIGDTLNDEQKQKLANALNQIKNNMRNDINANFTESVHTKSESLVIERWQKLAGIIK
jgi:hypothetical protein